MSSSAGGVQAHMTLDRRRVPLGLKPARAHLLQEAGEAAFTQRVIAVGIHATSILEAGLARTAVQTPMRECVLVTRGVIPCRAVHEASVGEKITPEG